MGSFFKFSVAVFSNQIFFCKNFVLNLILILLTSSSLLGQEKIFGEYKSNVADLGFFVTTLKLNSDFTFEYTFSGDLIFQDGSGTFEVNERNEIFLKFIDYPKSEEQIEKSLVGGNQKIEDKKFKYKNGKLYFFHVNGHLVKKGKVYSKRKKYLFWGERYLTKRRIFLRKVN